MPYIYRLKSDEEKNQYLKDLFQEHAAEQVKVTVSAKTISEFNIMQKEITVTSDAFEHFYPDLADKDGKGVTYADALVAH